MASQLKRTAVTEYLSHQGSAFINHADADGLTSSLEQFVCSPRRKYKKVLVDPVLTAKEKVDESSL